MTCVVCATRGGEGSAAARLRAIQIASELDRPLLLLMVVDPEVLEGDHPGIRTALVRELEWTGRSLLHLAHARAAQAGARVETQLRTGRVRDEILQVLRERNAARLVLGAPRGSSANVFGDDEIERFAAEVQAANGVEVTVARPEQPASGRRLVAG